MGDIPSGIGGYNEHRGKQMQMIIYEEEAKFAIQEYLERRGIKGISPKQISFDWDGYILVKINSLTLEVAHRPLDNFNEHRRK